MAEENSHLCLSNAMENYPLKEVMYPHKITKAHSRWWCLLFLLAGETAGQRFIMILEQVANDFARFQGSTILSTLRLFYMCNLLPEPFLNPIPPEDLEKNLAITLGMLGRTLKTLGGATGPYSMKSLRVLRSQH